MYLQLHYCKCIIIKEKKLGSNVQNAKFQVFKILKNLYKMTNLTIKQSYQCYFLTSALHALNQTSQIFELVLIK